MMKQRTEALAIAKAVKKKAAERDSCDCWPCCVLCGEPAPTANPLAYSNAHYIPRSQGGLGIEENIVTLCPKCHRLYDQSDARKVLRPVLRRYLREQYEGWDEKKLVYQKEK